MNKLLVIFVSLALLAGCGEEKQPETTPQNDDQTTQSQPATTNEQSEAAKTESTQENTASTKNDQQSVEQPQAQTETSKEAASSETKQAPAAIENKSVPVIDGTNEQTLTESLDKMIVNLTEKQKESFSEAFLIYAMSQVDMSLSESENQKKMLMALNGKSVQDILEEAEKLKEPRTNRPQADMPSTKPSQNNVQETAKPSERESVV